MVTTDGTPFGNLALNVYRGAESGPPLVFVHGVLRCWQDFRPLFPDLAYDWTCISVDHRGHGESERAGGDYSVMHYFGDIVQFVQTQFDEPVLLYGHSLGAMVVAAVAAELGEQVAGVIMEDPPFETMGSRIAETPFLSYFEGVRSVVRELREPWEVAPALADIQVMDPVTGVSYRVGDSRDEAAILFAAKCLCKVDPLVLDPIVEGRWLVGYQTEEIFSAMPCPALLLQADTDCGGMLTDSDVTLLKSLKPNLFHVKFDGAGHLLHWTRREQVLAAVQSFLVTP